MHACQIASLATSHEPFRMTKIPISAFAKITIDFASVDGETLLVMVDDYSRFSVVEPVTSTSANAVIPKLDEICNIRYPECREVI